MGLEIGDHLAEVGAAGLLGRFHVHVLLRHREACAAAYSRSSFSCAGIE